MVSNELTSEGQGCYAKKSDENCMKLVAIVRCNGVQIGFTRKFVR